MKVSVRDFKAKLSRYLKDARARHDVVVTSRGRPIVRLLAVPEEIGEEPGGEELLRRLKLCSWRTAGRGRQTARCKETDTNPARTEDSRPDSLRGSPLILYLEG